MAGEFVAAVRRLIDSGGADNPFVGTKAPKGKLVNPPRGAVDLGARLGEERLGLPPGSLQPVRPPPPDVTGSATQEPRTNLPAIPDAGSSPTTNIAPGAGGGGLNVAYDPLGLAGDCPGLFNVKIAGQCVDLSSALPGGDPMITGQTDAASGMKAATNGSGDGFGDAVKGRYGVGIIPRVDLRPVRSCPRGMVLGKDGVCYERRDLRKSDREWNPGMKPLLTGGDRAAIARARAVARKLDGAKKSLKKTAKALGKATC